MTKNRKLTIILGLLLVIVGAVLYLGFKKTMPGLVIDTSPGNQAEGEATSGCLKENEYIDYPINPRYAPELKAPLNPLVLSMRDTMTQKEKFSFEIKGINPDHYHPLELHECTVYVIREFNYDPKTRRATPNYRIELWKYNYRGVGEKVLLFSETSATGQYKSDYNDDFRIDPQEKYISLEQSYLGKDDYSMVIKDLKTKEDILILKLKDILAQNKDILPGSISLGGWTKDGKYLRGDIFDGALDTAYYQIEAGTWKTEIYATPPDLLAGVERAMNYDNWHLAYVDIPTFTGIQEVYEQIIEKAKQEGRQKNLHLYNLQTHEKNTIASTDPDKRFNIKWISDTELQYELPNGEKTVYKIKPITPTKTYINAKFSYRLQYPESLILSEKNFENYIFTDSGDTCKNLFQEESRPRRPLSQTSLINPSTKFNVEVVTIDVYENENNLSLDDWLNSGTKFLEKYSEECKYNDKNYLEIRLDNKKRVIINDTSGVEGFTGCCMTSNETIYLNKNNRIYEISFSGSINDGLKCIPFSDNKYSCPTISEDIYNQILSSFKFIK